MRTNNPKSKFHFRKLQAGYYFSNKAADNGQHIVIEKAHDGWIMRYEEAGLISKHQTVKGCKFALAHQEVY